MSHFSLRAGGITGALRALYKMRTVKVGKLVGTDLHGNQYFENREEFAHGQHRWVVYAGAKNFYEVDSSWVPPEWHSWLHHVTDEPPTSKTVGSTHRVAPPQNAYGSAAPYARNLGGVISRPGPNPTQIRPRGWGLGNGIDSKFPDQGAYTQPGWPLDPRNPSRFGSARRDRVRFTLRDTPLTLAAKEATKAGLALEEFASYADPDSPTRAMLLQATSAEDLEVTRALAKDAAAFSEEAAILVEGAAGLPTDPAKIAVALKVARGLEPSPEDKGTFAAAAKEALTPAEETLLREGASADRLLDEARKWQRYVDDYSAVPGKDAARGVAIAKEKRDAALAKVEVLRSAEAKLGRLTAQYDEKAEHVVRETVQSEMK